MRIGLALSGGGFRATLFHLGLVRFLRNAISKDGRSLLSQVKYISSVSGGSITAAHLVLNWEQYNGTDSDFNAACLELRRFTYSNLRARVFWKRVYKFPRRSTIECFSDELFALFGDKTVDNLKASGPSCRSPKVEFLSTDLNSAAVATFGDEGFWIDRPQGIHAPYFCDLSIKVRDAVATSAAYPLLFPPLQLTLSGKDEDFIGLDNLPRDSKGNLHLALSDGGVYENSGAFMVKWRADHQNLFPLLVSDAGAPFRLTRPQNYLWVYRRTARTLDVLSRRVADLQSWMTEMESTEKRFIEVKLYDTIVDYFPNPLTPEEQRRIAEIRTDLDDFNDIEAELLLQRGEKLAHAAWFRNAHVLNETAGKLRGLPGWELDDDYSLSDDIPFSNFRNVKPPEEIRGTKLPLLFVLASSLLFGGNTEKAGLHIDAKSTRKAAGGPQ